MSDKADVCLWKAKKDGWHGEDGSDSDETEDEKPQSKILVQGPVSRVFPAETGWSPQLRAKPKPRYVIDRLSHVTIKRVTKLLTAQHTLGHRPNCEANWQLRFPHLEIPWNEIWKSIGTFLSDATEEKHWRKLLHRGIYVYNRGPPSTTGKKRRRDGQQRRHDTGCRLKCGQEESMLHLTKCRNTAQYLSLIHI